MGIGVADIGVMGVWIVGVGVVRSALVGRLLGLEESGYWMV